MKYIKKFEDNDDESQFKMIISDLEKRLNTDFKGVTLDIRKLQDDLPYNFRETPPYKEIYWNFIKKWHHALESNRKKGEDFTNLEFDWKSKTKSDIAEFDDKLKLKDDVDKYNL